MTARILLSVIIASFLLPVLLFGCGQTESPRQEVDMVPNVTIPPIDASIPADIETATFALG